MLLITTFFVSFLFVGGVCVCVYGIIYIYYVCVCIYFCMYVCVCVCVARVIVIQNVLGCSQTFVLFLVQDIDFREPVNVLSEADVLKMKLKYYNPQIHAAAFVLPEFARKVCTS